MGRIIVRAADVQEMTGYCQKTAERFLLTIKKKLNKTRIQFVDAIEFSEHAGINLQLVLSQLK